MNLDPDAAANEFVAHYVRGLSGSDEENAWHRLAEAGPGIVPAVIRALQRETEPRIQVLLIRVLAESRSREAVPLLRELMLSNEADTWKTALDALVTIGGEEACDALGQARRIVGVERQPWIDEALAQVSDAGGRPG